MYICNSREGKEDKERGLCLGLGLVTMLHVTCYLHFMLTILTL